jgi:hypothetical protein
MSKRLRKITRNIASHAIKVSTAGKAVVKKTVISPMGKVGKTTAKVADKVSDKYKKSPLKSKVDKTISTIDKTLDKTGVKTKAKRVKYATKKHLDTFTGTRQFRLMQERMALQQRYNDILATKLEEALQRIERLENIIEQKKK